MRTRMVPFDSVVPFLRRLVRQTADELGKRASLRIEGAQGEMDRNLLERMKAPFEHMLRNALAHGVESPADRQAAGKPAEGAVKIAVSREATEVVIRVSDDGKGMVEYTRGSVDLLTVLSEFASSAGKQGDGGGQSSSAPTAEAPK